MATSDFEKVKKAASLKAFAESKLEKARGGLVCPKCGSGTGRKKTPAFSIAPSGDRWTCFSCNAGGDVFDLAGAVHHTDDRREQLEIVARWAGVPIEERRDHHAMAWDDVIGGAEAKAQRERRHRLEEQAEREEQDRADEAAREAAEAAQRAVLEKGRQKEAEKVKRAREAITAHPEAISYLEGRGFTRDEIERFGFGWHDGKIIIPWRGCDWYHIDRSVSTDEAGKKYVKPRAADVGPQPMDNPAALEQPVVFVVEGMLDALAVEAMGHSSIALAGTGYRQTLEQIAAADYEGVVVLMLDGDEAGRKAQGEAAKAARALGLQCYGADFTAYTGAKDAAEALQSDREAAAGALSAIRAEAAKALKVQDPAQIAAAIFSCRGEAAAVPTGIRRLDTVLNGGLRPGLTVIGAVSSAGKTTLCVQIADAMAKAGRPVLFVSIEQSGRELVAKSLSRLMAGKGYKGLGPWEMGNAARRLEWGDAMTAAFYAACDEYAREIAPRLRIMCADEQPKVMDIREAAEAMRRRQGAAPVVFVDYLQLIGPRSERDTDKMAADYNVSELRRLARDTGAPVIVVSSLNRTSYTENITEASFKESGGIEYGADLLLGLQPERFEERIYKPTEKGKLPTDGQRAYTAKQILKEYRASKVRKSEIVIIKNRNGALPSEPLPITFYAASSLFVED